VKKLLAIAAAIAAFGIINVANADTTTTPTTPATPVAPATPTPPKDVFHGKIATIDTTAKTITIDSKKMGSQTYTYTDTTEVKVDDKAATIADLTVGMHAGVKFDGSTALKINAHAGKAKTAKNADTPLPGTASAPTF
jgi:hypothetical protein